MALTKEQLARRWVRLQGRIFRLHFNRIAMQRGQPDIWSIQTSKGCFHAAKVIVDVVLETEYQPDRKTNPRAFLTGRGRGYTMAEAPGVFVLAGNDRDADMLFDAYLSAKKGHSRA